MIGIVSRVPDRYVMLQTAVRSQKVIGPGAHHPIATPHDTFDPTPQPKLASWDGMGAHILYTRAYMGITG